MKFAQLKHIPNISLYIDCLLILLLMSLLYAYGLGSYPAFIPDEARYSEVAREMLASGDYILPRLNGVVFLDKPILHYWLQVLAIKMFGLSEFAMRFFPALSGIWGVVVVYITGRLVFSRCAGILAAVMLGTSVMYFVAAHYANLDLEVAVLISTTLSFVLIGLTRDNPQDAKHWFYAAYVFAALAVLTKGMIGIALPALVGAIWIIATNNWRVLSKLHLVGGGVIISVLVLPWYISAQIADNNFWYFFFIIQQVSRFLSTNVFNNANYWWFYIPVLLLGALPWVGLVLLMIYDGAKFLYQHRCIKLDAASLYLLIWLLTILTFFSIPHSKTLGYILPVLPAIFLLLGQYTAQAWHASPLNLANAKRILYVLLTSFLLLASAGYVAVVVIKSSDYANLINIISIASHVFLIIAITDLILLVFFHNRHVMILVSWIVSAMAAVLLCVLLVNSGIYINQSSNKFLALAVKNIIKNTDKLYSFNYYFQDVPLYTGRIVPVVANWDDPNIVNSDNWRRELWYGRSFKDTSNILLSYTALLHSWYSNNHVYVLLNAKSLNEFSELAGKYYIILQGRDVLLVSNMMLK